MITDFNNFVNESLGSSLSFSVHGGCDKEKNPAEKSAQQENPGSFRDFLKKIGSNFRIADRTLVLDFKKCLQNSGKIPCRGALRRGCFLRFHKK